MKILSILLMVIMAATNSLALDSFKVQVLRNSNKVITSQFDNSWYELDDGEHDTIDKYSAKIHEDAKNIDIYEYIEANNDFILIGKMNTIIPEKLLANLCYCPIKDKKQHFYQILLPAIPTEDSKNATKTPVWIHENDIETISKDKGNTYSRVNLNHFLKAHCQHSLDKKNIVASLNIEAILDCKKGEFYSHNCGIHALLAAIVMMYPEKLQVIADTPNLISELEKVSLKDNCPHLIKGMKMMAGLCFGTVLASGLVSPTEAVCATAAIAALPRLFNVKPFFKIEKLFRQQVGITPKKLVAMGNALLDTLNITEVELVLVEESHFDNILRDWPQILDSGSPIIPLTNDIACIMPWTRHYLVVHGLANKECSFWDKQPAEKFQYEGLLKRQLDNYSGRVMKALSIVGGLTTPFVYLYFAPIRK